MATSPTVASLSGFSSHSRMSPAAMAEITAAARMTIPTMPITNPRPLIENSLFIGGSCSCLERSGDAPAKPREESPWQTRLLLLPLDDKPSGPEAVHHAVVAAALAAL